MVRWLVLGLTFLVSIQTLGADKFCERTEVPTEISELRAPQGHPKAYIISIYSIFVDLYLKGGKSFEFRKNFPCEDVNYVVFYNNKTRSIEAIGALVRTLKGHPQQIIPATVDYSGVTEKDLWDYYKTSNFAYATEVKFSLLPDILTSSEIAQMQPDFSAPQGYSYLDKYPQLEAAIFSQIDRLVFSSNLEATH